MAYIIETRNLHYHYSDGTCALHGVNLSIPRHSKTAILGPNGAGKSTLFLHFNGLLQPSSGNLLYSGKNIQYDRTHLKKLRQRVGLVFQNPDNQLFSASVQQDISFGLLNLGYSQEETRLKVNEVGGKLGVQDLFMKPTHFLSTGQKKLIALAGVLVMEPELIICDEPTAGLDQANAQTLMELMDGLHQNGTSIVISTHDVNLAYSWASHVILLNQGQVLAQGKPDEVFSDSSLLAASSLEKPWILESWEYLQKCGSIASDQPPPTTKEEYFMALSAEPDIFYPGKKVVSFFGARQAKNPG